MIPYTPLNKKQVTYIQNCFKCWLNVAEGGKRAAKNTINVIAYSAILDTHPDKLHLVAGVTVAAAKMNVIDSNGFGLKWIFQGRCREGKYMDKDALYIQTPTGEKVVIIAGGGKVNDAARIKGNSYGTVYLTEVNEMAKEFVMETFDRTLSSSDRKMFLDLNPKSPAHWFYSDILDYQDELKKMGKNKKYNYEHFTIADNSSLTTKVLKELLATYDKASLWYQADILGARTAGAGRIYTSYKYTEVVKTKEFLIPYLDPRNKSKVFVQYSIGVDIGGTDATVATLSGFTPAFLNTVLLDGYYHKQGKSTGYTHDIYAKEIVDKLEEWIEAYPGLLQTVIFFVESADKLFRQALRNELDRRGYRKVQIYPAYKKDGIIDRIRLNSIIMNQGRFFIMDHLKPWIQAYENATWDEKGKEKGEWIRTDDGSYPVDCLDSTEYGIHPFKPKILKGAPINGVD